MKITKTDVAQMKNLINALEGATYPQLDGKNVIALARCFEWLAIFNNRLISDYEESEALASSTPIDLGSTDSEKSSSVGDEETIDNAQTT